MKATGPLRQLRPSQALTSAIRNHQPIPQQACTPLTACQAARYKRNPLSRAAIKRSFSNPFTPAPQTLTASRTLAYPASDLYNLIVDIPSYPKFLPYCQSSEITSESSPDSAGKRHPRTATLRIGWGGVEEEFLSKIYCVPNRTVEAIAGDAVTTLPPEDLELYKEPAANNGAAAGQESSAGSALFSSLRARWQLKAYPYKPPPADDTPPQEAAVSLPSSKSKLDAQLRTDVNLVIEATFANPVYAAMSQAAAPKVANMMIDAFQRRADDILGHKLNSKP